MPFFIKVLCKHHYAAPKHKLTWCDQVPFISRELLSVCLAIEFWALIILTLSVFFELILVVRAAPVAIVLLTFLFTTQYLVGHLDLLEAFLLFLLRHRTCWWHMRVLIVSVIRRIRVIAFRHIVVGLLDLWLFRIPSDSQDSIQVHVTVVSEGMRTEVTKAMSIKCPESDEWGPAIPLQQGWFPKLKHC